MISRYLFSSAFCQGIHLAHPQNEVQLDNLFAGPKFFYSHMQY